MSQLAVVSGIYLLGITLLSRKSLMFEATLSVALPLLAVAAGWTKYAFKRLNQLLIIESFYNLLALLAKVAIVWNIPTLNAAASTGFVLFFIVQLSGFVVSQVKNGKPHGVIQSLCGLIMIFMWRCRITNASNTLDADGRFMMWGERTPFEIMLFYVIWFLNVSLVDSSSIPWLRQQTVHIVSVGISLWSGEFFHVRLLTACHLFVCDLMFGYSQMAPERLGLDFARLSPAFEKAFYLYVQPAIAWSCTLTLAFLLCGTILVGFDSS